MVTGPVCIWSLVQYAYGQWSSVYTISGPVYIWSVVQYVFVSGPV